MMSMIAGEGTNSDGSAVTMTGQERERTDAEMTGMTGKMADSLLPHAATMSLIK